MSKDKKQLVVFGALLLVVVAIGAFQFMGKEEPKTDSVAIAESSTKGIDEILDPEIKVEKDPVDLVLENLLGPKDERDPFIAQGMVENTAVAKPVLDKPAVRQPESELGPTGEIPWPVGDEALQSGFALDEPPYTLRGVVIGNKTLAVLENSEGSQFMVVPGQTLSESETKILAVEDGKVIVDYRGRVKELTLQGGN